MQSDLDRRLREAQEQANAREVRRAQARQSREEAALGRLQQRRQSRRPRLVFQEDQDGWQLWGRGPWWRGPVLLSIALLALVAGKSAAIVMGAGAWALFALTGASLAMPVLLFAAPVGRYRVMRDGRMAAIGWRGRIRLVGDRSRLSAYYGEGKARIVLSIDGTVDTDLSDVGSADVAALQEFCTASGVKLESLRASRSELIELAGGRFPWAPVVLPVLGGGLFVALLTLLPTMCGPAVRRQTLEGRFDARSAEVGTWSLRPKKCLSGRERGFAGVAFLFAPGDPVEELRLDAATDGDNAIVVRLRERPDRPFRVRERDCKHIEGQVTQQNQVRNGRPMTHLEGRVSFACPAAGIDGEARFSGCLPSP